MEKNYEDIENTTIADYTVALRETENKILESLRNKNLKEVKDYTKLYFKLVKLLEKRSKFTSKERSRKSR